MSNISLGKQLNGSSVVPPYPLTHEVCVQLPGPLRWLTCKANMFSMFFAGRKAHFEGGCPQAGAGLLIQVQVFTSTGQGC